MILPWKGMLLVLNASHLNMFSSTFSYPHLAHSHFFMQPPPTLRHTQDFSMCVSLSKIMSTKSTCTSSCLKYIQTRTSEGTLSDRSSSSLLHSCTHNLISCFSFAGGMLTFNRWLIYIAKLKLSSSEFPISLVSSSVRTAYVEIRLGI